MEIATFMQKLSSCEGVTDVSIIRNNVVKLNLGNKESKAFFIKLRAISFVLGTLSYLKISNFIN